MTNLLNILKIDRYKELYKKNTPESLINEAIERITEKLKHHKAEVHAG